MTASTASTARLPGRETEWPVIPFGELTENFDSIRVPIKESERKSGPYPYYGASGIVDSVHDFLFDGEYLLIAEDGENLRTRQTPIAFMATGKFWVNNHAHIVRGNRKTNTRFLNYVLANSGISGYLTGSTMPKLTQGNMNRIPIPTPPRHVQDRIVEILGTLDDKIDLNRRMNETLEELARTLFKSWFIDFDPVHAKAAVRRDHPNWSNAQVSRVAIPNLTSETAELFPDHFEESDCGKIPSGWKTQSLEALVTKIGSGATPRGGSKVYVDDGVALVRSQNVYDHEFRWDGLARITDEAAEALDTVALEPEDILFNITGASILRTCVVDPAVLPARVNQHVARIRTKSDVSPRFVHLHLVRQEMKDHLIGFNAGATREAITKAHLQSIRLVVPPTTIMRSFSVFTSSVYSKKQSLLHQIRSLTATRDSLLPRLLSGQHSLGP